MEILLRRDETFTIKGDARGTIICCRIGALWITQEGDSRDHCISAGETFTIDHQGTIIIEARRDGGLHFETAASADAINEPMALALSVQA